MKEKYIVKPIVNVTAVEYTRMWGVYDNSIAVPDSRHYNNSDPNLNLVVECKSELIAEKIAELLNLDSNLEEL